MRKLINPQGQVVKLTCSNKMIAAITGLSLSSVEALMCGRRISVNGWISCHRKAKKGMKERLNQFQLHNTETGEITYTWKKSKEFTAKHELGRDAAYEIRRNKTIYRNWITKKTYDLLYATPGNL